MKADALRQTVAARRPARLTGARACRILFVRSQGARRRAPRRGVRVGLRSATGNRVGGVTCLEGSNPSLSATSLPRRARRIRRYQAAPWMSLAERWQSG